MNLHERFYYLRYFFDGYYNQSYDDFLEERFHDFLDLENDEFHSRLKKEILDLEQVYLKKDLATWQKIEEFIHEDSLRYLHYKDGLKFIQTAKKCLF
ncbi:hypothetical protein J7E38_16730 [Bacillus sp. ISL-35]|uniref:hypothetical protein n=1 Tax=Bacillus sp. ISL-35 TaxID=2819122 RepID=UPI001BE8AD84|nr:hypothetical protein [Bacillus sp. ISL-35]MBT2680657.1 hypothetical protein [Bacillus sp. ISL-35]MBT2702712.1 hypothetical protein [Chryseobacterium sp. ISL-80]